MIRFSALGDVAMTVPVIQQALQQNPQTKITVVSNALYQPLFSGIERCHFHPAYIKERHQGVTGLFRLYQELRKSHHFDAVADLHGVLRATILRSYFRLSGHTAAVIDKGRSEKKALTRKEHKIYQPLTQTFERYAQVLRKVGLKVHLNQQAFPFQKQPLPAHLLVKLGSDKPLVGVAPFAHYIGKMYPANNMKMVVSELVKKYRVLLFGSKAESAILDEWVQEMGGVINIAGKYTFSEELAVISQLSVMLCMDSANMHLASLFGVRVVSIWGATHPFAGFYGWGQDPVDVVSAELSCRPCSVFGNKPCWRGDYACMHTIAPEFVVEQIDRIGSVNRKE